MLHINDIKIIQKISSLLISDNVDLLSDNTVETWQKDRTKESKKSDTKNGKLAEDILENYIQKNLENISYVSYDLFRADNFEKHAPFDGLVFNKDRKSLLSPFIDKINLEIQKNNFGKISDKLKKELLENHIYIVEVKSTRVTDRFKKDNNIVLDKFLYDDFLEYPRYLRTDKDDSIHNWKDYYEFSKKNRGYTCDENNLLSELKENEIKSMRHIYIRVYIDEKEDTGYVIGCIGHKQFMKNGNLKKMKKFNKSEKALYLASNMKNGSSIDMLNKLK